LRINDLQTFFTNLITAMKKLSLSLMFLLTLLCLCQSAGAQSQNDKGKDNFFKRTIHGIFNPKVKYDTLYICRPWGKWTVSVNENFMQNNYFQFTESTTYTIRNEVSVTTGISLAYKGIGLGYSVNFKKLNGKTSDKDMTINLYGNWYGIDFHLFNVGDFYDKKYDTKWPEKSNLKGLNINAYYVFNRKKFSYPAAFSHSQIQKKSAGSAIAGISFYTDNLWSGKDADYFQDLKIIYAEAPTEMEINETLRCYLSDWQTQYLSIGAGYAYNWVPGKGWLIHVSAELSPMIYQNMVVTYNDIIVTKPAGVPGPETTIELENSKKKLPYSFLNFTGGGKISATYSWKRGFVGAYYIGTMNHISLKGAEDIVSNSKSLIYHWWNAKIAVGFRF